MGSLRLPFLFMETTSQKLIQYLQQFMSESRFGRIREIIQYRTNYITVMLEDIYQSHNASAVLRTCDCFGVQQVHVVENRNKYTLNRDVSMGSDKWLTLQKYNQAGDNTLAAIQKLKADGYRIVATTPHSNDTLLDDIDIARGKMALLFGTELKGLSNQALELADEYLKIPLYGFTESYNISVSAAIILHHLTYKLHQANFNWQLDQDEQDELVVKWLVKSIRNGKKIANNFLNTLNANK